MPDHPQALINRATIRIEQRRFADALADVQRVLEKDPQSVDGWTKRGNVLVGDRRTRDKAIASFDKALAIKPDHVEALQQSRLPARRYRPAGRGARCYDRVLELDPRHVEAWINRGHVLLELHREEECLASLSAGARRSRRTISDAKLQ